MAEPRPSLFQRVVRRFRRTQPALPAPATAPSGAAVREWQSGDAGRRWQRTERGYRNEPLSTNPNVYTVEQWSDQCDTALDDPKARAAWMLRLDTAASADISAHAPKGTGAEGEAIAEAVNRQFGWMGYPGEMVRPWGDVFLELFSAYGRGCALAEERPEYDPKAGVMWIRDLEPRHIANVQSWDKDEHGRIHGVHMRMARIGRKRYYMPINSPKGGALHIARSQFGDPEGRDMAMLGPLFDYVALKNHMTQQAWTGISRWATPVPNAIYDHEAAQQLNMTDGSGELLRSAQSLAQDSAVAFLAGEDAALFSSNIVRFEEFGGSLDLSHFVELGNYVDHQTTTGLNASHLVMGVSATQGSRSAAEAHGDILLRSVAAQLDHMLCELRRQTVRRFVLWNFGPDAPVPLLRHEGIDVDGLAIHLAKLQAISQAGFLRPDDDARRKVRRVLGLLPEGPDAEMAPADTMPNQLGSPGPGRGMPAEDGTGGGDGRAKPREASG